MIAEHVAGMPERLVVGRALGAEVVGRRAESAGPLGVVRSAALEPRKETLMKALHTVVSKLGYRDWRGNAARLGVLANVLTHAAQQQCGLVVLPAGFFRAHRPYDVITLRDAAVDLTRAAGNVGLVLGIDAGRVTKSTLDHLVRRGQLLPFWGLAVEPGATSFHMWQQQTFLSHHGTAANAVAVPERTVVFHGKRVLVLLCGEMFNQHLRAGLAGHGLDLVVDAGHDGLGMGLVPTLRSLATNAGCPALCSQHVGSTARGLHMVLPNHAQASVPASHGTIIDLPGAPWVSAVERTI